MHHLCKLESFKPYSPIERNLPQQSSSYSWLRKKGIVVHGLYTHQGLNSFFQLHQAEDEVLFYSMYIRYSPVEYDMWNL